MTSPPPPPLLCCLCGETVWEILLNSLFNLGSVTVWCVALPGRLYNCTESQYSR